MGHQRDPKPEMFATIEFEAVATTLTVCDPCLVSDPDPRLTCRVRMIARHVGTKIGVNHVPLPLKTKRASPV